MDRQIMTITEQASKQASKQASIRIRQATKQGYIECAKGGIADLSYPTSHSRRGRVQDGGYICPTITCKGELYRMEDEYAIYSLTTKETWRFMDFSDEDHDKAAKVNAKTNLYKQAGNSIVVNVLVAIFGQMFEGKENMYKQKPFERCMNPPIGDTDEDREHTDR